MQNALIVAQVAVSMVLLVGAGLLLASFYRSQTVDPGYRANHVLSAEAFTNFSKYPDIGAQLRFYQPVLEVFAALALLVTMAGITGVIATSVSQRTQEFGVRIVLGASRGRVLGQVIGRGLTLVAIGLAIGAAASAPSTRALSAYLFDPRQPIPRLSSPLPYRLSWQPRSRAPGPAWRATTVDSMQALRAD